MRSMLGAARLAALASALIVLAGCAHQQVQQAASAPAPVWTKIPIPEQAPAFEGYADIPDVKLWYWDTGGDGEAIVLLHPWSQSSLIWKYQQPVFAAAGYRTIALSRRGSYKSEPGPSDNPGTAAGDVLMLADRLGIQRFHLVGCAAGGVTATAFAVAHQERLLSLTLCGSIVWPDEQEWRDMNTTLRLSPPGVASSMTPPTEWMELSASYRAGNPEGLAAWVALEHLASPNGRYTAQPWGAVVNWETIGRMRAPTLLMTGDSDLSAPPSMQRLFGQKFPNAEVRVIDEAAHATYWEQPEAFNAMVLDWVGRHGAQ